MKMSSERKKGILGFNQSLGAINCLVWLKSLLPSDGVWRHRSRSTLTQVMACCLTAPNHYLKQCWLLIKYVLWHSLKLRAISQELLMNLTWNTRSDITRLILLALLARAIVSYFIRKRWRATACCGKSKLAISSGWLKKGSVSHPDDIITLPWLIRMRNQPQLSHPDDIKWKSMSSGWHNEFAVTHPDEIPTPGKSSGWHMHRR